MGKTNHNDYLKSLIVEYFSYDPNTGIITRKKKSCNRHSINEEVGHVFKSRPGSFYKRTTIKRIGVMNHIIAWVLMKNEFPNHLIDHADGNGLNNKWNNLREATNGQNIANSKINSSNKSGYKGVSWSNNRKKWESKITHNNKRYRSYYDSPEEAHNKYQEMSTKLKGEFARFK